MKAPTIRLAYLIELLAALAIGLAAIRWALRQSLVSTTYEGPWLSGRLAVFLNPLFQALAVVEGVGLLIEAARRRRPTAYGPGRWTWAFAGGVSLLSLAADGFYWSKRRVAHLDLLADSPLQEWLQGWLVWGSGSVLGRMLLAGGLAYGLARPPADPEPDGREWAGRLFGVLAVGWGVTEMILRAFDN